VGGRGLDAGAGLFKPVAMGPNEVEDAAAEINSRVQIVSPPPDQKSHSNRGLRLLRLARGVTGRSRIFLELGGGSPVQWISNRRLNSLTANAQPIYQHAHSPRTVRHFRPFCYLLKLDTAQRSLMPELAGMRFNEAIVRSLTGVAPGATHERRCRTSRPPTPRGLGAPVLKATLALPCR
jgi:hypothetical protein